MEAGKLRERLILLKPTTTQATAGDATTAWAQHARVRGGVRRPGSREFFQADRIRADIDYIVRIRHRADIDSGWRLLWQGHTLEVRGIGADRMNSRWLDLRCSEVA